jgi:hypothetical protein
MADNVQLTTHELWVDGRKMSISASKVPGAPTSLKLEWNLPPNYSAYDGAVVLLSEERFSSENFPVDGTRYVASSNWASPADNIGKAKVVAAFYGYFGDSITATTSVTVTNVDPDKIYFASIHAASNILQYYTVGTQSYPLESSRFEKQSETYAGSIPYTLTPPENPTNGQAYYDSSINSVLIWNEDLSSWVKSNQKTIPTGIRLPIAKNQIFFNSNESKLKFFDGTSWVECNSSNTRVKLTGSAWAAFNSASSASSYPESPSVGDFVNVTLKAAISAPSTFELKFFTIGAWFIPAPNLVQVFDGSSWNPIQLGDTMSDSADPIIPSIGDFFYNSSSRDLMVWAGSEWVKADTENEGTPTTDKIGVGTDGSYDERLRLIKVLKHQLGYPSVCSELTEENFNVAIDNALDEFRRRADNAYAHRHISFTIKRGQVNYYLNDPRDKTDKIVSIIKIHRINHLGISSLSAETGLYAQAFFNQLYQGSNVDVLSIHLMNQLSEVYEKIFAGNLSFTWDEASRQLTILRRILQDEERVLLEVAMERPEQELLYDRWAKQWLQGWAQSECWEMLGEIRSKYGSLPGPGGGITLNGDSLLARATEQQTELLRQLADYEAGNGGVNFGNTAFMIG